MFPHHDLRSESKEISAETPMSVHDEVLGEDSEHLYVNVSTSTIRTIFNMLSLSCVVGESEQV
jgi:hypothetical protein